MPFHHPAHAFFCYSELNDDFDSEAEDAYVGVDSRVSPAEYVFLSIVRLTSLVSFAHCCHRESDNVEYE